MLGGRVDHTIDDKNRIRIPANYLSAFPTGEPLFFVEYATGCISIMPESVKDRRIGREEDCDPDDEEAFDAMRIILSSVMKVEIDTQGRAIIPKYFREIAGIKKNVVTIGFADFIEIWDRDRFEEKRAKMSIREANAIYYKKRRESKAGRSYDA